jgi:hypothetical protein
MIALRDREAKTRRVAMSEGCQNLDVDGPGRRADPHAVLLDDLADFVTRHRHCGQLTGGDATEPAANSYLVTVGCSCGVVFKRWVAQPPTAASKFCAACRRMGQRVAPIIAKTSDARTKSRAKEPKQRVHLARRTRCRLPRCGPCSCCRWAHTGTARAA